MTQRRNTSDVILAAALLSILLIGGVCLLRCLHGGHPAEYIWMPSCPLRVWTGLLCPGCGTLRATHYFLNGRFDTAFRCQPLLFVLSPILVLLVTKILYEKVRRTSLALPFELQIYWLLFITIGLFFVLRNIPLDCLECLRPPDHPIGATCP